MAKKLHTIIRYHQYQVDEKRRALGQLLGEVAALEQRASALEEEIIIEQKVASAEPEEAGYIYGAYAEAAIMRREYYADTISDVEKKISEAQEEVRQEFKDLKVFEITQNSRDEIENLEERRRDSALLDEIGQQSHQRRKSDNKI